jgi:hypothetical protein
MKENPFLVTHKIAGTINNSFQEFVVLKSASYNLTTAGRGFNPRNGGSLLDAVKKYVECIRANASGAKGKENAK